MRKNTPLILVALICAFSLLMMTFALNMQMNQTETEFTPPPFDKTAVVGVPVVPDGLGYAELDCQAYRVSLCGKLTADGQIWLTNPLENSVWLKMRVLDEKGRILGETGLVRPGEYVQTITLTSVPKSGTPVILKIMGYEPDTYYSAGAASLNTIMQ